MFLPWYKGFHVHLVAVVQCHALPARWVRGCVPICTYIFNGEHATRLLGFHTMCGLGARTPTGPLCGGRVSRATISAWLGDDVAMTRAHPPSRQVSAEDCGCRLRVVSARRLPNGQVDRTILYALSSFIPPLEAMQLAEQSGVWNLTKEKLQAERLALDAEIDADEGSGLGLAAKAGLGKGARVPAATRPPRSRV